LGFNVYLGTTTLYRFIKKYVAAKVDNNEHSALLSRKCIVQQREVQEKNQKTIQKTELVAFTTISMETSSAYSTNREHCIGLNNMNCNFSEMSNWS